MKNQEIIYNNNQIKWLNRRIKLYDFSSYFSAFVSGAGVVETLRKIDNENYKLAGLIGISTILIGSSIFSLKANIRKMKKRITYLNKPIGLIEII